MPVTDFPPYWKQLRFASPEECKAAGLDPFYVSAAELEWKVTQQRGGKPNGNGKANGHYDLDVPFLPTEDVISGAELDTHKFAPVEWIINDVLPTGLAILAGKSKIGKSWLAMDISVAAARGSLVFGKIATNQCDVLYIALEDSRRRLQSRMRKMLVDQEAPENLRFATQWPDVDHGCLDWIKAECEENPRLRLVIVDTFGKVRGRGDGRSNVYQQDYRDMSAFHQLATSLNIVILLIHHTRKQEATDVMDLVSGSTGIVGAADTLIVLQRKRGQQDGTLSVTGRDIIEDGEFALTFHKDTAKWEWLGEAKQVAADNREAQIIRLLQQQSDPMGPTDIASELEISLQTVKNSLNRLRKRGSAHCPARGLWAAGSGT